MANDEVLTVQEAAERLKVRPEAVRRMLRDGRIRGVRLGGTKLGWRIPVSEIRRLLTPGADPLAPGLSGPSQ